jgi:hypothetical protein
MAIRVTIAAVPFPFTERGFAFRQHNAIQSWLRLKPTPEIILLGDDDGVAEYAAEWGLHHIGGIRKNKRDCLDCSHIFEKFQKAASNEVVCYFDCDIITLSSFLPMVEHVTTHHRKFLIVSGRWSAKFDKELDFDDSDWEKKVREAPWRHHEHGSDYFVFRNGLYDRMPPFSIGAGAWDGWKMWYAVKRGCELVRADYVTRVVHQDHGPRWGAHPSRTYNHKLAGDNKRWVKSATVTLRPKDLK